MDGQTRRVWRSSGSTRSTATDGDLEAGAERFNILFQHVDGHVAGPFDRGDSWLGDTDPFRKVTL